MAQAVLCGRDAVAEDCGVNIEAPSREVAGSPAPASDVDSLRHGGQMHRQVAVDANVAAVGPLGNDFGQDQARSRDILRVLLVATPVCFLFSASVLEHMAARRASSCSNTYYGAKLRQRRMLGMITEGWCWLFRPAVP